MIKGKFGDASARDMAEFLGLSSASQFPDEGMDGRLIQGHHVWVTGKVKGRMSMRCMTRCLTCDKVLPVGRLAQHERSVHQGIKHGRHVK